MDDLISRQAAIDLMRMALEDDWEPDYATDRINELPSAQPEQKRGRWLPDNRRDGGFWVCSECKFPSEAFAADVLYKFCPHCGAYMRGEQDGRDD